MNNEEILEINLILVGIKLLNTREEAIAFRRSVGTEVSVSDARSGNELVIRSHNVNRDRITVTVNPDSSAISREFPRQEDLDRLAEVAGIAMANTVLEGQQLRAFGYNVDLVFEPNSSQSAIEYLRNRLFLPNLLQEGGRQVFGGSGRLHYQKNGYRWQVVLEPRLNEEATSRVFAGINLHRSEPALAVPTEDDIRDSLNLVWAEAHSLVSQLDGSA